MLLVRLICHAFLAISITDYFCLHSWDDFWLFLPLSTPAFCCPLFLSFSFIPLTLLAFFCLLFYPSSLVAFWSCFFPPYFPSSLIPSSYLPLSVAFILLVPQFVPPLNFSFNSSFFGCFLPLGFLILLFSHPSFPCLIFSAYSLLSYFLSFHSVFFSYPFKYPARILYRSLKISFTNTSK